MSGLAEGTPRRSRGSGQDSSGTVGAAGSQHGPIAAVSHSIDGTTVNTQQRSGRGLGKVPKAQAAIWSAQDGFVAARSHRQRADRQRLPSSVQRRVRSQIPEQQLSVAATGQQPTIGTDATAVNLAARSQLRSPKRTQAVYLPQPQRPIEPAGDQPATIGTKAHSA